MTDTIMVGIDGSESSRRAVRFAVSLAKSRDARLVVVYVIEWSPYTFNTPEENEQRHKRRKEELQTANERVMGPMLESLQSEGVDTAGIVRHGNVTDVLLRIRKEQNVSQIIVGRVGHTTISSVLFGSVAGKLIQLTDIPVTVIP